MVWWFGGWGVVSDLRSTRTRGFNPQSAGLQTTNLGVPDPRDIPGQKTKDTLALCPRLIYQRLEGLGDVPLGRVLHGPRLSKVSCANNPKRKPLSLCKSKVSGGLP